MSLLTFISVGAFHETPLHKIADKIMKKFMYILFILVPMLTFAQQIVFEREQYPFPVTFYGVEPHFGFVDAGKYYHHDFGDIDNDGDFDIIIGTSFGQEYFAENIGTPQQPDFQLITNQYVDPGDDNFVDAPAFVDIDNDGDLDLFTGFGGGYIVFFRNLGTPDSAVYELESDNYLNYILSSRPTLAFIDIDGDNDFDFFAGSTLSTFDQIYFFRNEGTPDSADFVYVTDNFAGVSVDHFACPEFCDLDDDGDYDMFVGCEEGTIWYYENTGDSVNYNFVYRTNYYGGFNVGQSSMPRFCDIDDDGDFDLFIAHEGGENIGTFEGDMSYYENIGSPTEPEFAFITGNYLWIEMSGRSSPALVDIDADGSTEMLVAIGQGQIIEFRNYGTNSEPEYAFEDSAYFNGFYSYYGPKIVFGDLDSDNDYDLIIGAGDFSGYYLKFYFNSGNPSNPEFSVTPDRVIVASQTSNVFPGLCDIDGDSDLDLFFGTRPSLLIFYENIGDPYNPNFQLMSEDYLNTSGPYGTLSPRFSDLDFDGDYDLVLAHSFDSGTSNYITHWRNDGTPTSASFVLIDTIDYYEPAEVLHLSLELFDIDDDGDDDLFVGEGSGGMLFYRNESELQSVNGNPSAQPYTFTLHQNYPNPFNASTVVPFTLDRKLPVKIAVYNQLGQVVTTLIDGSLDAGSHQVSWDASGVGSGVYLVRLDTQQSAGTLQHSDVRKVILVK